MKKYYITYSYFESCNDEEDDLLSYGYLVYQCDSVQMALDSIYNEVEGMGFIMAAIYSITVE